MPIGPTSGFLDFTNATPRADVIIALSNVGVGTDVPLHALDIRGTANVADIIINNDLTLTGGLTTNTLTINNVSMSTTSNFQQVTNVANDTTNTVRFTNPTTGFTVSSNAEVGGELSVSGNTAVSSNLTVSGNTAVSSNLTVSGNVGIGTTEPTESLDIVGNLNLQKVSNATSIKLNSNVVTEYTRSKKLIKYPRVAMTAATTSGYTASASSERSTAHQAYQAFNMIWNSGSYTDGWNKETNTNYNGTDNTYNPSADTPTRNLGTGAVDGEWLKLELPVKVLLQNFKIYSRWNDPTRAPEDFKVYGSNDNTNWVELLSQTGQQPPATGQEYGVYTNVYYKYFGLVVTKIYGQNNYFAIDQVEYYGVPEYDPDAHGTDVIMRSVPNVPNTDWLEVYYDGQDYTSMPSTVTDKSGNSVTGTPTNVTFDSEYKAFTFDGTGDIRSTVSTFSGDQPHTMSTWVYISSALNTADAYICVLAPSTGENLDQVSTIRFQNDGFNVQSWGNDIQMYNLGIQKERWYHLTVVYDGGGVTTTSKRLYINGVQNLSISGYTASGNTINFTNTTLSLGSRVDGSGSHLKGSIANFRLFNRALTSDEIWQLYAYQKEYFDVSPDVVTFKGGRLGIGTSDPRATLEVRGDIYGGCPVYFHARRTSSTTANTSGVLITWDTVETSRGGGYDPSNGKFTAPIKGVYKFIYYARGDGTNNAFVLRPRYNDVDPGTGNTAGTTLGNEDGAHASAYLIHEMNEGDTLEILLYSLSGTMYISSFYNGFYGYYLSSL